MSNQKRLAVTVLAVIFLCVALAGIGYALGFILYEVRDNYFRTGTIDVSIAYAPPTPGKVDLFDENILYEPGMTVRGDFTVTNNSTDEEGIWYRIYFTQLDGDLAEIMEARILDGEETLLSGKISHLTNRLSMAQPLLLEHNSAKTLTLELHYPEPAGNETQGSTMQFALAVVAVQRSNNPTGNFS